MIFFIFWLCVEASWPHIGIKLFYHITSQNTHLILLSVDLCTFTDNVFLFFSFSFQFCVQLLDDGLQFLDTASHHLEWLLGRLQLRHFISQVDDLQLIFLQCRHFFLLQQFTLYQWPHNCMKRPLRELGFAKCIVKNFSKKIKLFSLWIV